MKGAERDTTHRASRNDLVLENIFCFSIQLVSELVDPSDFVLQGCSGRIAEKTSDRFSHEGRPICRNMVDLLRKIIGNCDVYAHVIKVSQEHAEPQGHSATATRRWAGPS
jgi:hypothetical protein